MQEREDDELGVAEAMRALTRHRRRGLIVGVSVAVLTTVTMVVWSGTGSRVRAFVRGEATLSGEPIFEPEHEMSPYARTAIDWERVHTELIPNWTVGLGQAATSEYSGYWGRVADARFDDLAHEIEPDPTLSELMASTHDAVRTDPLGRARRLDYWLWAYNRYLDDSGVPWRLEAALAFRTRDRAILHTRSYEILADARTPAGHRVRLLRRADRFGSVEGWLGRTGRYGDGAMVLMRRVLHFTVRHVWPALHRALDERRPEAERSWLPWVRVEVSEALDDETYRLLSETAEDQQALIEVAAEIRARRACGSQFQIVDLPYNGLSRASVESLELAVLRSRANAECPEVTLDEAARVVGASERLAETEGLEEAIERLTMLVARSVAAHELRHAADGDDPDAIECPGCPEGLVGIGRAEVSAYLSAMATEGLGYLALFQACATPSGNGIQGAARDAVVDALLPYGCEGPTLWGLYEIAREIEVELFGERPRVSVPALPARVPLLPRSRSAASSRLAAGPDPSH